MFILMVFLFIEILKIQSKTIFSERTCFVCLLFFLPFRLAVVFRPYHLVGRGCFFLFMISFAYG